MSGFEATALYIGVNAVILAWLSVLVVRQRFANRVVHGDGGSKELQRVIRAHGNAAEYMAIALLVIAATEASGAPLWMTHALGIMFTLGRLAHAATFVFHAHYRFRQTGMALTFLVLVIGGGVSLVKYALF
jgi:uncharacterized membrane protein YecN with MAPEG domain